MNPYDDEDYFYNPYIAQRETPPPMQPMMPGLPEQPVVPPIPTPMPGPRPPMPGPRPPMPGPRPPMPGPRPPMPGPRPPMPGPRPPMPGPRPPMPGPRPPRPRPIPVPVPVPQPRRPLNVYLCRFFSAAEGINYCQYTVAFGDQPLSISPECRFVAGPFFSLRDAEAFIESFGVRRDQVFIC